MTLSDLIYPDCHLCRTLRASLCAGLLLVLATYAAQLLGINREMRAEERARLKAPSAAGLDGLMKENSSNHTSSRERGEDAHARV